MKTVAYLRVSTTNQDLDQQRLAILDYAQKHKIVVDEFVSFTGSSRQELKQRAISELLSNLAQQDMLLVSELSRLGRSVAQIIFLIDQMVQQQISFVAIKEGIKLKGSQDLQTKVMVTLFSLFAEIERDLISERTKEGITAARAKGKILGRPKGSFSRSKLDGKEDEIRLLLKKGVSLASIAKIMEISRTALRHFIRTRKLS